jgi:hypothetical protein
VSVEHSCFLILNKEIRVTIKSRTRGLNTQRGRTHAEPRKIRMRDEASHPTLEERSKVSSLHRTIL